MKTNPTVWAFIKPCGPEANAAIFVSNPTRNRRFVVKRSKRDIEVDVSYPIDILHVSFFQDEKPPSIGHIINRNSIPREIFES